MLNQCGDMRMWGAESMGIKDLEYHKQTYKEQHKQPQVSMQQ